MAADLLMPLVILSSLVFLLLGFLKKKKKLPLPPGPPTLPLIGHMHIMDQLTHRGLARLANKYGGIMYLRLGFMPTVVVSAPDAAKEVLKEQDGVFSNRPATLTIRYLTYGLADMAFANYGPFWRQMRKLCVMKLFSRKRAESWASVRHEIDGLIRTLAAGAGTTVNLGELVFALTRNITFKAAFGSDFDDDQNVFLSILQEFSRLFGAFNIGDFVPWLDRFDLQGLNKRLEKARGSLDRFTDRIIDDHMAKAKGKGEDGSDMVDELLAFLGDQASAGAEEVLDENSAGLKLTRENVKAIVMSTYALSSIYHDRSPSRQKNLSKSLRISGAFKHPKDAGVVNDIAFLIENDDSFRKTKLFKFFFPKKSRSDGPTSNLLIRTLPAVRPSLNYFVMQYFLKKKNKMHFDPVVVKATEQNPLDAFPISFYRLQPLVFGSVGSMARYQLAASDLFDAAYGDKKFSLVDLYKPKTVDVMFGGTETVASAIEWVMAELMNNPKEMEKVQDEMKREVGLERQVEESDIERLVHLKRVFRETLRLHPPIPMLMHETAEETELLGYRVPARCRVMVNAYAIGRNPEAWPDANKFVPDRFASEGAPDFKGSNFELIPFGSGRRSCPGMQLGLYTLELAVARMVHSFTWALPDGMKSGELDMSDTCGLTAPRAKQLEAVPTPRLLFCLL
ncbi:Cytochrome P450 84A1 [Nymphaea thermarum]|nr:Cytochrome P450 84A1 [Nymphaea thermarum]